MIEVVDTIKLPETHRNCPFCGSNQIEDEFHFLFNCSTFSLIRNNFYSKTKFLIPNITADITDASYL